ncbi:hypothetical protein STENM327S_00677 [Streptomyces tendae]
MSTTAGAGSLIIGVLLVVLGVSLWFQKHVRVFAGVAAILLALVSIPVSNLGGFLIGFLFALVGGAMAVSWVPGEPPRAEPPLEGKGTDGTPEGAVPGARGPSTPRSPASQPGYPGGTRGAGPPGRDGRRGALPGLHGTGPHDLSGTSPANGRTGGTVPADEVTRGTDVESSRVRTGPRHAAPKKPLFTRFHMPAGKADSHRGDAHGRPHGDGLHAHARPRRRQRRGAALQQPGRPTSTRTAWRPWRTPRRTRPPRPPPRPQPTGPTTARTTRRSPTPPPPPATPARTRARTPARTRATPSDSGSDDKGAKDEQDAPAPAPPRRRARKRPVARARTPRRRAG